MAVIQNRGGIWANPSTSSIITGHPVEYLCDTQGELPAGVEGDGAYAKDTHKYFKKGLAAWVELGPAGAGTIPAGLIGIFTGLIANIPSGWVLCNGSNGTPDLRSSFVKGAAAAAEAGSTGGATTHTHAAHSSHTHDYTQVINHTHTVNVNDPGHFHTMLEGTTDGSGDFVDRSNAAAASNIVTSTATTGVTASTVNPAGGVATGTTAGPSASLTHDSPNSEPPYFTVLFIMKT